MSRKPLLSTEILDEVKALHAEGMGAPTIVKTLAERGIIVSMSTIYYQLGRWQKAYNGGAWSNVKKKQRRKVKTYLDYLREDCKRRGVPYRNPRAQDKKLWS